MNSAVLNAYSDVILGCALSITRGDRLWLRSEPVHIEFVKHLVRRAYEMGAEHVEVSLDDPAMGRIRIDNSVSEDFLDYVPGYTESMYRSIVEEGWRSLALRGPSEPDLMQGVSTGRLSRMSRFSGPERVPFSYFIQQGPMECLSGANRGMGIQSAGGKR
jgi:aminopeptidase